MYKFRTVAKATAIVLPFALTGLAHAATDGAAGVDGAASVGTSDVSVTKTVTVQITNLADLAFGSFPSLAAPESLTDDVCVYASDTNYSVTLTSLNGGGGAFAMIGTNNSESLPYTVTWGADAVTEGEVFGDDPGEEQTGDAADLTCAGADNAAYTVTIANTDFNGVTFDEYTDTLTITVLPE